MQDALANAPRKGDVNSIPNVFLSRYRQPNSFLISSYSLFNSHRTATYISILRFIYSFPKAFASHEGLRERISELDGSQTVQFIWTFDNSPTAGRPVSKSDIIPFAALKTLECSPIKEIARAHWWRAITSTFLLRPNAFTLRALEKYSTLEIDDYQEVINIFVRHGDKGIEMKLLDLSTYLETVTYMWNNNMSPRIRNGYPIDKDDESETGGSHKVTAAVGEPSETKNTSGKPRSPLMQQNGTIFLTTDDQKVVTDAKMWGKANGWKVVYTELYDRSTVSAAMTWANIQKEKNPRHDPLEYFNFILNLQYSLRSEAWVCTFAVSSLSALPY